MSQLAPLTAPSLDDLEDLALAARVALPAPFAAAAEQILLRIADFAEGDLLDEVGAEDAFDLTGLYEGIPLTEKSVDDGPRMPDTIWLFRRPILDEWAARGDIPLGDLVAHVLVHELAHHFGWTDDQIAAIDPWWEP